MDKQDYEQLSGDIAYAIATESPVINYTQEDVDNSYYPARYLELCHGDRELLFVLTNFLRRVDVLRRADDEYLCEVVKHAKKYTPNDFAQNPFLQKVHFEAERQGDVLLTSATYQRGEFFQYDMPDLGADIVVPRLAFCTGDVSFPTVYQGQMPWMSACPSEINSMKEQMAQAHGKVLVLGLGLGYYPFIVAQKQEVEHITIIEIEPKIIDLFNRHIFPHFENKEKITIVQADAIRYLQGVQDGQFDFCFADIWEGQFDGAKWYKQIAPFEDKLPRTQFTYWIKEQIEYTIAHHLDEE